MTTFELLTFLCLLPFGAIAWTALLVGSYLAIAWGCGAFEKGGRK